MVPRSLFDMPSAVFVIDMIGLGDEWPQGEVGDACFLLHLTDGGLGYALAGLHHAFGYVPVSFARNEQLRPIGSLDKAACGFDIAVIAKNIMYYLFDTMAIPHPNMVALSECFETKVKIVVGEADIAVGYGDMAGFCCTSEVDEMVKKRDC